MEKRVVHIFDLSLARPFEGSYEVNVTKLDAEAFCSEISDAIPYIFVPLGLKFISDVCQLPRPERARILPAITGDVILYHIVMRTNPFVEPSRDEIMQMLNDGRIELYRIEIRRK